VKNERKINFPQKARENISRDSLGENRKCLINWRVINGSENFMFWAAVECLKINVHAALEYLDLFVCFTRLLSKLLSGASLGRKTNKTSNEIYCEADKRT